MKIKVLGSRIYLKVDESKAGTLVLESMPTAVECGEVIEVGSEVTLPIKKGDKIFYKSWACDVVNHNGQRFIFIDEATRGICAIVTE
jgi:co-chaperonin GroES (HSP10)